MDEGAQLGRELSLRHPLVGRMAQRSQDSTHATENSGDVTVGQQRGEDGRYLAIARIAVLVDERDRILAAVVMRVEILVGGLQQDLKALESFRLHAVLLAQSKRGRITFRRRLSGA